MLHPLPYQPTAFTHLALLIGKAVAHGGGASAVHVGWVEPARPNIRLGIAAAAAKAAGLEPPAIIVIGRQAALRAELVKAMVGGP